MSSEPLNVINNNSNNGNLSANFIAKMKAEVKEVEALIAELGPLAQSLGKLEALLNLFEGLARNPWTRPGTEKEIASLKAQIADAKGQIAKIEDRLKAIDPGFTSLCNALNELISGEAKMIGSGDDLGNDLTMFNDYLNQILASFKQKLITDLYREKLKQDGTNNGDLMRDSIACMPAAEQENVVLCSLQAQMVKDLGELREQENEAKNWLSGYQWYDKARDFFTGSDEAADKRAIIQNSEDMTKIILQIMTDLAPELAQAENAVYDSSSMALQKIIDKIEKLLKDPTLTNNEKTDQIKYLMGLALGILAMIQTDAAKEKAADQKKMSTSSTDAAMMNLQNSKAELKQFEHALSYANAMGLMLKIVKPVVEVGGMMLAPGIGSFMIMAAFAIADNAGLTDKLKDYLAKHGCGEIGAEAIIGSMELVTVVGGGAILDQTTATAAKAAADVAMKQSASEIAVIINETVDRAMIQANRVGDMAAEASVRAVVSEAVNNAARSGAEKTVEQFSKQASATLIPQLVRAGKEVGSMRLATVLAKAAEKNCITAAEMAAKTAGNDIAYLAEAAADGANITGAQISGVSSRAANTAAANVSSSTGDKVASETERTGLNKAVGRGAWVVGYNALSNGAFSYTMEQILKKAGADGDDLNITMEVFKAIEQILASMTLMAGTGVMSSTLMEGSSTTALKVGTYSQLAASGTQAIGLSGQANASLEQADAIAALNKTSVSSDMLQNYLKDMDQQKNIDQRYLSMLMSEQSSNFTLMSQLDNNLDAIARALATEAV